MTRFMVRANGKVSCGNRRSVLILVSRRRSERDQRSAGLASRSSGKGSSAEFNGSESGGDVDVLRLIRMRLLDMRLLDMRLLHSLSAVGGGRRSSHILRVRCDDLFLPAL